MAFVLMFLHLHLFHSTSLYFSAPWSMCTPLRVSLRPNRGHSINGWLS